MICGDTRWLVSYSCAPDKEAGHVTVQDLQDQKMLTTRERRSVTPAKEWKEILVREMLNYNFVTIKS